MIPGQFEYARPASVPDALRILRERVGEAKVLSGGYSLLPLLKLRLAQPALLVDIRDVGGLDGLSESGGQLRIGARVTHARLETDPLVKRSYEMIAEAAHGIGDRQVRNWGTVGGSVAHADPSADWPAVFLAMHASFVAKNVDAERVVPARDWFLGVFTTAIEMDELVTEIRVPTPPARSGGASRKSSRSGCTAVTAIRRPAIWYGETMRSAPAWRSFDSASGRLARATMKSPGTSARAESVT